MRRVRINGKAWTIRLVHGRIAADGRVGECDYDARTIRVQTGDCEELDCIVHEVLHALYPKRKHKWINRTADAIAAALVVCGYRRLR